MPIDLYWGLPPLAYLPLLIIWLGIGESSKVLLLTLATFAPICFSAQAGVRSVPSERINAALSLGATRRQIFTKHHAALGVAGNPDRPAHRHRCGPVDAGGGRADRCALRASAT